MVTRESCEMLRIFNEELKKQVLEVPELFAHQIGPVWRLAITSIGKAVEATIERLENGNS